METEKEYGIMLGQISCIIAEYLPDPSYATTLDGVELLNLKYKAILAENLELKKRIQILTLNEEEHDDLD